MRKLTDEELSRVLGEADAGLLDHERYAAFRAADVYPCGCVAGAALELDPCGQNDEGDAFPLRYEISQAIDDHTPFFEYPKGADAVLKLLVERGLA